MTDNRPTVRGPEGTCPLETSYGTGSPTTYCTRPTYTGQLLPAYRDKAGNGWCASHLVEWGYLDPDNPEALAQARDERPDPKHILIAGEYGVVDGSIHLFNPDGSEKVMWDSAEWVEDPSLVYVIVNAVVQESPDNKIVEALLTLPWGLDEDISGADLVDTVYELLVNNGRLTEEEIENQRAEAAQAAYDRKPDPGDLCASYKIGKVTVIEHRVPCEYEGKTMTASGKVLTEEDLGAMRKMAGLKP